ncbi:hypothetical protein L209DRAFT_125071 [Thermothelomyces heterothallicus CBS 203.75]
MAPTCHHCDRRSPPAFDKHSRAYAQLSQLVTDSPTPWINGQLFPSRRPGRSAISWMSRRVAAQSLLAALVSTRVSSRSFLSSYYPPSQLRAVLGTIQYKYATPRRNFEEAQRIPITLVTRERIWLERLLRSQAKIFVRSQWFFLTMYLRTVRQEAAQ